MIKLFKLLSANVSRGRPMGTSANQLPAIISYHPQGPKGDMLKYQSSLPKLPVPPLQQSLQKYLKAVQPLVNDEEFKNTCKAVEEFGMKNGTGEKLQKALEDRAKIRDNWLKEWWDRVAYLSFRESVAIKSNPSTMHPKNHFVDYNAFIRYATKVSVTVARYMLLLRSELMPPEVTRNGPLCMSQHVNLLSCCRVPCNKVDIQIRSSIDKSRHIIVAHNGHFYSLDILSLLPDGSYALVPAQHIEEQLHKIVQSSPTKAQHTVGVLTTEHRDTWCSARERLVEDPVNRTSLDLIQRAQFILCLDSPHPDIDPHTTNVTPHQLSKMSGRCLHGNGTAYDSCNRWFDHVLQIFVSPDGSSGSNLEHSAADGVAAFQVDIYALDMIHQSEDLLKYNSPVSPLQLIPAQKLEWKITPGSAKDIETAKVNFDNAVSDCDHQIFVFEDYGKGFVKSQKLSPDSFIQIAIQLTFYKMYGHLTATYESASTRRFLYGRTDTIRGASLEALAFCKAMQDPSATDADRAAKLVHSVENHRQYVMEALSGQVFDRHLLGLKLLAEDESPSLFNDPTYTKSLHYRLSTSQIPSAHDMVSGYGEMYPDGYAVCYNPQEGKCLFAISSSKQHPQTDTAKFGASLLDSLREMRTTLASNIPKAKL